MSSTSVYAVSVDSRSRNPDEPDNAYTVQLKRTMDRVKSVQLGSFQFQDARPAFTSTSTLKYSEPVVIPVNTRLRLVETCRVVDKVTNIPTETTRTLSMTLPPTLNKITSMSTGTQELTTEFDHGMFFGATFYPEIGLRLRVVGGDFPQDLQAITTPTFPTNAPSPVLVPETVESPFFTRNSQTFTWTSGYLSEMTSGVGSEELRMVDTTGTPDAYHSYIHAPPPTLVELFIMLNSASTFMGNRVDLDGTVVAASFATPIVITTSVAHNLASGDQVVISGVVGNDAANGTFFITTTTSATTFELDGSVGVGGGVGGTWFSPQRLSVPVTFGFDNEVNKIAGVAHSRVTDTLSTHTTCSLQLTGSLADLLGFGTVRLDPITHGTLPPSILRTVKLKPGTPDAFQLASEVAARLNPLDFRTDQLNRTFSYRLPGGTLASLVIDFGHYSPTQLTEWMTFHLSTAPANMTVTYNSDTGRFTITHNLGLPFSIDFTNSPLLADKMGFETTGYADSSSFTSVKQAVFGIEGSVPPPANSYTIEKRVPNTFVFRNSNPSNFYAVSGTSVVQTGGVWTPLTGQDLNFAHHLQPGDILTAQNPTLSGAQGGTRVITSFATGAPIVLTTSGAHGLTTGDNITIQNTSHNFLNGTFFVTVTGATTFELDGSSTSSTSSVSIKGRWWTNVSFVTGSQKPNASYDVVVKTVWDASTGAPLLTLEPTASMFSVEDAGTLSRKTLGVPSPTDGMINLVDARRNVFMLHFEHPEGSPEAFGFPPVAWPPSNEAVLVGGTGIDITKELTYEPSTQSIPVSTLYESPNTFTLNPPGYILVIIKVGCAAQDTHTHSYRGEQFPIFAKLLVNSPYVHISEEMHFTTFAGHEKFNNMIIEFQNPDGSPVQFNGRPHNYTLLFTTHEDKAVLACI